MKLKFYAIGAILVTSVAIAANVIISPNMGMPIPVVGTDPGPDWANNINASLSIIDQHDHTAGRGVLVPPSGLNINSDLSFQNNNATQLRSTRFTSQASPLAGASDLGALYVAGADLYYNDESGNQVRITQSGSVTGSTGTITGLPSGTASASFNAGTFTFQSATNTPANMAVGPLIVGTNTVSPKTVTIAPPGGLGANYNLTLPNGLPGVTSLLSLDTSGNMASTTSPTVSALTLTGALTSSGGSLVGSFGGTPNFSNAVGIGTATPAAQLDVYGAEQIHWSPGDGDGTPLVLRAGTNSGIVRQKFQTQTGSTPYFEQLVNFSTNTWIFESDSTANIFAATSGGLVGIGTSVPTSQLDVLGAEQIRGSPGSSDVTPLSLRAGTSNGIVRQHFDPVSGTTPSFDIYADLSALKWILESNTTGNIITATQAGNVGIGSASPGAKFDVNGQIKATSLNVNGQIIGTSLNVNGQIIGASGLTLNGTGGNTPHSCTNRTASNTSPGTTNVFISCSGGEIVTGGGCAYSGASNFPPYSNFPASLTSWECQWQTRDTPSTVSMYAICCTL